MPLIESPAAGVSELTGLHLYHAGRSNCSARVRLLLHEKFLPWVSHHVDIYQRANVTPEYFAINPKGLVPTLVHDGKVVAESNDILLYLEDAFPVPGFTPELEPHQAGMRAWLRRSGDIHMPGIKTYAYAKSHAATVVKTPEEVARYRSLQKDPDLLAFHGKHDLPGQSFSDGDVRGAAALLHETLREMDGILSTGEWLTGDRYSLADISWSPSINTLQGVGFPVEQYENIMAWHARITARKAFNRAVTAWRAAAREGTIAIDPRTE